jgi:phosphomannomutase
MTRIAIAELMEHSGVKFGTSGARGLVEALTDRVAYAYTSGFLSYLARSADSKAARELLVGGDLRPSTERILRAVARAGSDGGHRVVYAGRVPSPAVMLAGVARSAPSIMVTGSHIPDDRNGIKFNTLKGEILKPDENGIREEVVELPDIFSADGALRPEFAAPLPAADSSVAEGYVARWVTAFPRVLAGRRIGVYGHSAVGRELLVQIYRALGAEVLELGWSERFIPVDTEAIRPEDIELGARWAREHSLFALVSTDGDSDRPLIADETGKFMRGDIACVLAARFLGAKFVAAPVNCNSVLERSGWFQCVRTRIGSPFVIEAMQAALTAGEAGVVGYEANGGFLQGSSLDVPGGGTLSPLPTRDPVVLQLALLCQAASTNSAVSSLTNALPPRFTASDRLQNFATAIATRWLGALVASGPTGMERAFPALGRLAESDLVDGLRMTFASGEILHVRPSGNAPELRCYVEAGSEARAAELLHYGMTTLEALRATA